MALALLAFVLLAAAAVSAQESPEAEAAERPGRPSRSPPAKIERYAEALLRRYDANADGALTSAEWSAMRGRPEPIDRDRDGQIVVRELIDHVRRYSRQRSLRLLPAAPAAKAADAPADAVSAPAQVWRRFFVPRGEGSPEVQEWFDDNDVDGDGQVTMSEFSPTITEVEAARFAEIDANGDGVIVPVEYRQSLPPESESLEPSEAVTEPRSARTAPGAPRP